MKDRLTLLVVAAVLLATASSVEAQARRAGTSSNDRVFETPSTRREAAPQRAEEDDDSDTVDLLWIEAFTGIGYVNMRAISYDDLYPKFVELTGAGPTAGLAAGFRISLFSVGLRGSLSSYPGFEVGTLAGEVGVELPIPIVVPYVRAGLGYAWHGDANYDDPTLSETSVYGLALTGALGIDLELSDLIALGFGLDVDVLNMSRQKITTAGPPDPGEIDFREEGDAVGIQLRMHAHLSLHF